MKFTNKIKNIVLICILINAIINQEQKSCKKFTCSEDLLIGECLKVSEDEEIISLRKCENDSDFCNLMKRGSKVFTCDNKSLLTRTRIFPGLDCSSNQECIYGTCLDGLCKGKDFNESCEGHNQCPLKSSCRNGSEGKTCQPLSNLNENCNDDYDCQNNLGCHFGTCINYISLPNGAKINKQIRNHFPLCESGYDLNGVCESLTTKEGEMMDCNPDKGKNCNYIDSNNNDIVVNENCLCGKNATGTKFCAMGNNSPEWVEYLNLLKKVLSFPSDNCNTVERTLCKDALNDNKKIYDNFRESSMLAMKQHELAAADKCVLDIFFPLLSEHHSANNRKIPAFRYNSHPSSNEKYRDTISISSSLRKSDFKIKNNSFLKK
jgi:hypothetical protein